MHRVKSVRIWSYSGPHCPAFGLNMERYGISLCIQSECGKIRTGITPNTDTFHAVMECRSKDFSREDYYTNYSILIILLY